MKRIRVYLRGVALVAWASLVLPLPAMGQAAPAPAAVPATIRVVDKEAMKVVITACDGTKFYYRNPDQPEGASISIPVASLDRFSFDLTLDEEDLNHALMDQNWTRACVLLWPVVSPVLPYLGIKNNNATDLAMTLGNSLVKAAVAAKAAKGADEEKANRITLRAYNVFSALAGAEWCPDAEPARLKAILCLVEMKNLKQADKDLRAMRVPDIGDQTMGLYWYTLAALREANGKYRDAMDALVKSIAFENKDIEIFPDALMMSARLYEAVLEPYRARDVYYEVARLFPDTDWARTSRLRLQSIMDQKLTVAKEVIGIERTFFGLDEDVNAKATSLLKGTLDPDKPEATEESMDAEGEATGKTGEGEDAKAGEGEEAPPTVEKAPAVTPAPTPAAPARAAPAKHSAGGAHTKTH